MRRSSQASPQRSSLEANAASYSNQRRGGGRRSLPIDNRPILLRQLDPAADLRPGRSELAQLLAGLTSRDVAILAALDDHRYLDQQQVRQLFFDGQRHAQIRTKWLRDQHLIQRWTALQPPGWHRLHSVVLNSVRGAGVLAATRDQDARPYTTRAREAAEHCLHFVHDLGANGFFASIAAAARHLEGEGLYHWIGEAGCRREYRLRGARITPDGWGRYLTPEGDIVFLLEWDRATEFPKQLEAKVSGYVTHYRGRERAELNNVLFVAPDARREEAIRTAIAKQRRAARALPCCTFWTANAAALGAQGPLAGLWRGVIATEDLQPVRLREMPAQLRSDHDIDDCIGKPRWWERRPAGGSGW